jgi:hypothetical protein
MAMDSLVRKMDGRNGLQELLHFLRAFDGAGERGVLPLDNIGAVFANYTGFSLEQDQIASLVHLLSGGLGPHGIVLKHAQLEQLIKAEEDCIQLQREWLSDGIKDYEVQKLQKEAIKASFNGVRFFRRDSSAASDDPRMEGCALFLTEAAQKKRSAVKADLRVRRLFRKWWQSIFELRTDEDDEDDEGIMQQSRRKKEALTEEQYATMSIALHRMLMPKLNDVDAATAAAKDWRKDSNEPDHSRMDFAHFVDAMFELCDTWTDGLDVTTYELQIQAFKEVHVEAEAARLQKERAERAARKVRLAIEAAVEAALAAAEEAMDRALDAEEMADEVAEQQRLVKEAAAEAAAEAAVQAWAAAVEVQRTVRRVEQMLKRLVEKLKNQAQMQKTRARKKREPEVDDSAERERRRREALLRMAKAKAAAIAREAAVAAALAARMAVRQPLFAALTKAVTMARAAAWSARAAMLAAGAAASVLDQGEYAAKIYKLYLYYRDYWIRHNVVNQSFKGASNRCDSCSLKRMLRKWHLVHHEDDVQEENVLEENILEENILDYANFTFPPQLEWLRQCRCGLALEECAHLSGVSFYDIFGLAALLFEQCAMVAVSVNADGHVSCDTATMCAGKDGRIHGGIRRPKLKRDWWLSMYTMSDIELGALAGKEKTGGGGREAAMELKRRQMAKRWVHGGTAMQHSISASVSFLSAPMPKAPVHQGSSGPADGQHMRPWQPHDTSHSAPNILIRGVLSQGRLHLGHGSKKQKRRLAAHSTSSSTLHAHSTTAYGRKRYTRYAPTDFTNDDGGPSGHTRGVRFQANQTAEQHQHQKQRPTSAGRNRNTGGGAHACYAASAITPGTMAVAHRSRRGSVISAQKYSIGMQHTQREMRARAKAKAKARARGRAIRPT